LALSYEKKAPYTYTYTATGNITKFNYKKGFYHEKIILAALIIISTALVGCAQGGLVGMIEHAGDNGGVGGASVPEDALHYGYGLVTLDDPVTGKMQNNGNTGIGAIDGQDKVRLLRRASV